MSKKNIFTTTSPKQTRKLGEILAKELKGGEIICLMGELGSGKTTFAQGVLKGLGASGPYTSPTFVVMKHYRIKDHRLGIKDTYHADAYRVRPKDILELGWEEIISDRNNVIIIEWAERIKRIVPEGAIWLKFEHLKKDKRKITVN